MINIFIGSSKESLDVASIIKKSFSNQYNCTIWIDDFFELNQSTYDTLVKKSIAYDYAVFVGGKDDLVKRIMNQKKEQAYEIMFILNSDCMLVFLAKNERSFLLTVTSELLLIYWELI